VFAVLSTPNARWATISQVDGAYEATPWYTSDDNYYSIHNVNADILEAAQKTFANSTASRKIFYISTMGIGPE
jgi:hypothetical protein